MTVGFDLPWRFHWKISGRLHGDVIEKVRACRPLSLVVELDSLERLALLDIPWAGTEVVIVFNGWSSGSGSLPAGGVDRWEFPVTDPDQAEFIREHFFPGGHTGRASLRWIPVKGSVHYLPEMLKAAAACGFGLTLPNRPADGISSPDSGSLPDPAELQPLEGEELSRLVKSLGEDRLRVHDFMISQVLGMTGPEPSGCEAGNSMAYIDHAGTVFPCRSLLIPLGSLENDSFEEVWSNPARDRIRRDLLKLPATCTSCSALQNCRGGCRGIVYHLYGHYGDVDPLCPRK